MKRILVIRIGRLGDTVLATPVIGVLRQAFGAQVIIDFASSPGASASILGMDERINRVFPISHRSTPWRLHRTKRELHQHSAGSPYDLVINLECGNECDDFIRFVDTQVFCGRPRAEPTHQPGRHCVDTEKTIYAELLGADITAAAEPSLQLQGDSQPLPVPAGTDYVVLNPGFSGIQRSGYKSHRGWPRAHWAELIKLLRRATGLPVLINGTPDEQPFFSDLLQTTGVHSLFGSSLATLTTALKNARCLISVDTGTLHLATALGTPVIALFGPTDPTLTGPYSKNTPAQVVVSGVDCQPCVNTQQQKKCKLNRCMDALGPEQVFESYRRVLRA